MSQEAIRQLIVPHLLGIWTAQYPDYTLTSVNRTKVDLSTQENSFANYEIVITKNQSKGIPEATAPVVSAGYLAIQVFTKENSGERVSNLIMDYLFTELKYQELGDLVFGLPVPLKPIVQLGWYKQVLQAPFSITMLQ